MNIQQTTKTSGGVLVGRLTSATMNECAYSDGGQHGAHCDVTPCDENVKQETTNEGGTNDVLRHPKF